MKILSVFVLLLLSISSGAQCPPTFDSNTDVCATENVDFTNVTNGQSYQWDFCAGDIEEGFSSAPLLTNSAFLRNRTVKVIEDNEDWYAFSISQTSSNLQRIELGNDLSNPTANYINLGTFSGQLNRPYDIDLIYDGLWHAFVPNLNSGTIVRLDFNDGIDQPPTFNDLGNFSGDIQAPNHVLIVEDGGDYFVFVSDGQNLIRLSFGSDITSVPISDIFNVAGSNTLRGLDIIKDCDSWVGIILSNANSQTYSVNFGSSLINTPAFSLLSTTNTIRFPGNVEILNEDTEYYGFIQGSLGEFYRFDFGTSISDFSFTDQSITDVAFTSNQNFALDIVSDSSKWYGFNFNLDNQQLIQFSFVDDCSASIAVSSDQSPSGVSYSTGGSYRISSRVESNTGEVGYSSNAITVSSDEAPSADFTIDASRCISNANTFTPNLTGLMSYSWDFGDGSTSLEEVETHQYLSAGTYTIRLDVNDGACTNFTEQEITIYPALATPTFDATSDDLCEQTTFTFTNTIDASAYGESISYEWYLNGAVISTQRDTTYVFENAGEQIIGLKSFIPGCESAITEQTFQIIPSPTAAFEVDTVCLDQSSIFTNLSTDADSYSWDFGDGNTSALFEPTHIYADTGTYVVQLTAFDASGDCAGELSKSVRVNRTPPTPSFSLDAPFCLESVIDLMNLTDDASFDGVSYEWTVTDFGTISGKDISITFTEPGEKTFQLQSFYRTCESEVISQTISIGDLPVASFSAPATCDGDAVDFVNESTGAVSYLWDFGDGVTSTDADPSHLYASADTYTVSLTVTNSDGCENQYDQQVTVSDFPSASFDFELGCTANGGVSFTDNSSVANGDIVSWSWTVDGEEVSNEQNPIIVFNSSGVKSVQLDILSSSGCEASQQEMIDVTSPISDFSSFTSDVCIGEQLAIVNTNPDLSYQWDFCAGDIEEGFSSSAALTSNQFTRNRTIKVIEDNGGWYAFAVSQTSNNLQRIDLGADLSNSISPTYNSLGEFNNALNGAYDIDFIFDGSIWRAFVANTNNNELIRFDFTNGILSTPDIVNLGGFSGAIQAPTHTLLMEEEGNYYAFVSSGVSIVRLSFGSDLTSDPVVDVYAVSGSSALRGLSLMKDCGSWVGLALSYSNSSVYSVDFSSSLSNAPVFNKLTLTGGVNFPSNVSLINENAKYYAFIQGALGSFYRFDFGTSLSDFSFTEQTIADAAFTSNQNFALDIVSDSSKWYGFNFNLDSRELVQLSFLDDCSASIAVSSDESPSGVSYATGGNYTISSRVESNTGEVGYSSSSITVSSDEAPSADFTIDASRCISNTNTFTPNITELTSYSWDFDGDGTEDSALESPTYQFPSAGTYMIRLDVNDGACTNFSEQEITIYPEPPVPSFEINLSTICIGSELIFTNTTDETGLEDIISYSWNFGGDSDAITKDASFIYQTSGTKTVKLIASIPGCEQVFEQTIEILAGPTSNFSVVAVCQNEVTVFENTSIDGISYHWDFGDGFESTAENPTHLYDIAGSYTATLTVTDANGCTNVKVDEVIVEDIPQVNFDFELACSSIAGVQFTDMSTVENADLIAWTWSVDGEEVSTQQNPIIVFENAGIKTVRLVVQSSNGCESVYEEELDIRSSPEPDFSFNIGCQGESSLFTDITPAVGNPITQWMWTVDGVVYNTQEVNHVFNSNGLFDVTLEVTAENFCSESITKTIEVQQLPNAAFTIDGNCSNEVITLSDNSTDFVDKIVSRNWMLNDQSIGNGSEVLIDQLDVGTYNIELEVETEAGCLVSSFQDLIIHPTPAASFSSSKTYGLPGDVITFTNTSTGGSNYQWLLNDVAFSNSMNTEQITFSEVGTHKVSLVTTNGFGCVDTSNVEILIAVPEVDLAIGRFEIVDQNGSGKIFIEIQNFSNLPVEITEVQIELENKFSVSEQVLQLINVGGSKLVSLNVSVPLTISEPAFVCINLKSQYLNYPDKNPLNNEKCLTLDPKVQIEAPYPNPVVDEFRLKVVLPKDATAKVSLINSTGKIEQSSDYSLTVGLNNIFIDMLGLSTGIYFVNIEVMGEVTTHRLVKF